MKTSEQIDKLAAALAKAQSVFPKIEKNRVADVGKYKYTYADLADILEAVRPGLKENEIALVQGIGPIGTGIGLFTRLIHSTGQWIEDEGYPLKSGLQAQEMGSQITYARRYTLGPMLGIQAEDDEDGAIAQNAKTPAAPKQASAAPPKSAPPAAAPKGPRNETNELSEAQIKRLFAIKNNAGWSDQDLKDYMVAKFQIQSTKVLSWTQYNDLTDFIEKNPVKK